MPPTQPKPSQLRPPSLHILLRILLRIQPLKMLNRTHIVRKLVCRVLTVFRQFEADVSGDCAEAGLEVACDEVEEGGFAGAVLADYGYAGVHAGEVIGRCENRECTDRWE